MLSCLQKVYCSRHCLVLQHLISDCVAMHNKSDIGTAPLQSLYVNKLAVDDDLVDMLYEPSNDLGALEAFVSIITGVSPVPQPQPQTPLLLVAALHDLTTCPHVHWSD